MPRRRRLVRTHGSWHDEADEVGTMSRLTDESSQAASADASGMLQYADDEAPRHAPDNVSLKSRTVRGSLWTIAGYGASNFLRIISNLILARLLFPAAF